MLETPWPKPHHLGLDSNSLTPLRTQQNINLIF